MVQPIRLIEEPDFFNKKQMAYRMIRKFCNGSRGIERVFIELSSSHSFSTPTANASNLAAHSMKWSRSSR